MKKTDNVEVVFSFDTTGSMYPCLTQVRRTIGMTIARLFRDVPNIRIGVIAHGDYCDAGSTYVTKHVDLTDDQSALEAFVKNVGPTGGGDSAECYELVLHEARSMNWTHGKSKVLVMVGDDIPHGPNEKQNTKSLDWRNECSNLLEMGVQVHAVQALGRKHATKFYKEVAQMTGGFHLELDQFSHVTDMLMAIAFKQGGGPNLQAFEAELEARGRMNRSMDKVFATLNNRKPRAAKPVSLDSVDPGRFQVLHVDDEQDIRGFVAANGLIFAKGRGFYEFTKSEKVQGYKEVVLMHRATGDMFTGKEARRLAGLPEGEDVRLRPNVLNEYRIFVQSTSVNRKLQPGTGFLYEVDGTR